LVISCSKIDLAFSIVSPLQCPCYSSFWGRFLSSYLCLS
jgi:hypothetical protein